jgi:hypothetical protein
VTKFKEVNLTVEVALTFHVPDTGEDTADVMFDVVNDMDYSFNHPLFFDSHIRDWSLNEVSELKPKAA